MTVKACLSAVFDAPWRTHDRMHLLGTFLSESSLKPNRMGVTDPMGRFDAGRFAEQMMSSSSGHFERGELVGGGVYDGGRNVAGWVMPGQMQLRATGEEHVKAVEVLAEWCAELTETALVSYSAFTETENRLSYTFWSEGSMDARLLQEKGLPLLACRTWFGPEITRRLGKDLLTRLGGMMRGDVAEVRLSTVDIDTEALREAQLRQSAPLCESGWVGERHRVKRLWQTAPAWQPLPYRSGHSPNTTPPLKTPKSSKATPQPFANLENIRLRWAAFLDDEPSFEERENEAYAIVEALLDVDPADSRALAFRAHLLGVEMQLWERAFDTARQISDSTLRSRVTSELEQSQRSATSGS